MEYLGDEEEFERSGHATYANVNCYYTETKSLPPRIVGYNNVFFDNFAQERAFYNVGIPSRPCRSGVYRVRLDADPKKRYFIDYQVYHNGNWLYKRAPFTGGEYVINEGNELISEVRVYPEDAEVVSFTYDATGQMTSYTDQKGCTRSFYYDMFGRLTHECDTDCNTLKSYEYHYQSEETK